MTRTTGLIAGAALALVPFVHGGALSAAPPPTGTIAIEAKTADGNDDPALRAFMGAASEAFTNKGFTILEDPAHTAYVAELTVDRQAVGTGFGEDPHAEHVQVGAGVSVPLSTGASSVITLRRTRLEILIRKRTDQSVVWDGAAVTVRSTGTRKGTNDAVASALSDALLQVYPVEPKEVLGIP